MIARQAGRLSLATLRWNRVGAIWALDFCFPPAPIDARFPCVLAVRDLASGAQLLALPCPDREAHRIVTALDHLFAIYGAPLVLKTDNEFDSVRLGAFLDQNRVIHLLSPPQFPRYNGAVEAGIGSLKTYTFYEAAKHGHAREWSSNDLEAGRLRANELARPYGFSGPSPEECWNTHHPIPEEDRAAFQAAVQKRQSTARRRLGLLPIIPLGRRERRAVQRSAIALALVDQGLLHSFVI